MAIDIMNGSVLQYHLHRGISMGNIAYKRKIHVIDRQLQYRTIAIFLFIVLVAFLIVALSLILFSLASLRENGLQRLESIFAVVLINDLVVMVLIAAFGIFYTHRIAGPVYRMVQDISRALGGEKGVQIKLRRHDNFEDLAENINRLLAKLEDKRSGKDVGPSVETS